MVQSFGKKIKVGTSRFLCQHYFPVDPTVPRASVDFVALYILPGTNNRNNGEDDDAIHSTVLVIDWKSQF